MLLRKDRRLVDRRFVEEKIEDKVENKTENRMENKIEKKGAEKRTGFRKGISLFLSIAMLAGLMPVTVFANERAASVNEATATMNAYATDTNDHAADVTKRETVSALETGETGETVAEIMATDGVCTVTVMGTSFNPYRRDTGLACSVFTNAGGSAPIITDVQIQDSELGKYFKAFMNEEQDRILFVPYSAKNGGQTYLMNEEGHEADVPSFISGLMNDGKKTKKVFSNVRMAANYEGGSIDITIASLNLVGSKPAIKGKSITLNSYYKPSYNQFPKNSKKGTNQSVLDFVTFKDGKTTISKTRVSSLNAPSSDNFSLANTEQFGESIDYIRYEKEDCARVSDTLKVTATLKDYWGGYAFNLPVKTAPVKPVFSAVKNKIALIGQNYTYFTLTCAGKYGIGKIENLAVKNTTVGGDGFVALPAKESTGNKKYGAHSDEPADADGKAFRSLIELWAKNGADAKFGAKETFVLEIVPENMASSASPVKISITKKDVSKISYGVDYSAVSMLRHYANNVLTIHSEGILVSAVNNRIHNKAAYIKVTCPNTLVPASYKIASNTPGEYITEKDLIDFEPGTPDVIDTANQNYVFCLTDASGKYTEARKLMFNASDTYGSGLTKKVTASFTFYTADGTKLKTVKVTVHPESKFVVDKEVGEVINLARPLNEYAYQYISNNKEVCNVPVVDNNGKTVPKYDISGQKEWFALTISGAKVSMGPDNRIKYGEVPVNATAIQKSAFYITDGGDGTIAKNYRVYLDYSGRKVSFVPLISYALTRRAGNSDILYVNYVDQNKVVSNKQKIVIKYTYAPALSVSTNKPVIYSDSASQSKDVYFYQDNILYSNERIIDQISSIELDPTLAAKFDSEVLYSEETETNPSKAYGVRLKKKGATADGEYTGNVTINLQGGKSASVKLVVQVKTGY